jgi:type II secretory pathway component GspD/PulD (secretin)
MSARWLSVSLASAGLLLASALAAPAAAPPTRHVRPILVTYQVADLVVPIGNFPYPLVAVSGTVSAPPGSTAEADLLKLITSTVAPKTWADAGGAGTIDYFPLTFGLVVRQTPAVQDEIAHLLRALRRMQDNEVAVELRLISVTDAALARAGVEMRPGETTMLDDGQARAFIEAVQGDRNTNVMQAPKVTMFNGQSALLNCTEQQAYITNVNCERVAGRPVLTPQTETFETGLKVGLRPVLSADNRAVTVDLNLSLTRLETPEVPLFPVVSEVPSAPAGQTIAFTQFIQQPRFSTLSLAKALSVPDGRTAMVKLGSRQTEVCTEKAVPVLSKVPYINRLFRTVGYGKTTEHVLLLVTPRVIVNEEEEKRTPDVCLPAAACPSSGVSACSAVAPDRARLAHLIDLYNKACAAGAMAEAARLAGEALAIDPTCFSDGPRQTGFVRPAALGAQ